MKKGFFGKKVEKEYFGLIRIDEKRVFELLKCEFDTMELNEENHIIATQNGKKGIIDLNHHSPFFNIK